MIPAMDSTRLKYIADCLLNVNRDAHAQLGADMMWVKDDCNATMLTIENENGGNVIDTQPFITSAETLRNGLSRFKGAITFAEDGKSHLIGADVTVCHHGYHMSGQNLVRGVITKSYPYRANTTTEAVRILASQDLKDDPVIYVRCDSEGHYIGILDNIRVRMRGNIEDPAYTSIAAAFLKRLVKMAKGDLTVEWDALSLVRFRWTAYGLRMSYYIAPRMINDVDIIKRLDRKVTL